MCNNMTKCIERALGGPVKDRRYIVIGGLMEYMAHLHCEADSEEEALAKWDKAFPTCDRRMFEPYALSLAKHSNMVKHWRHDGHRYYSGGYRYSFL